MCVSMCGAGGGGYLCSWSEFQKGFHKLKRCVAVGIVIFLIAVSVSTHLLPFHLS